MHSGGTKPFDQRHYDESAGEAFFRLKGIDMSKYLMAIQPQNQVDITLDDEGYLLITEHDIDESKSIVIQPNNVKTFIDSLIFISSKE